MYDRISSIVTSLVVFMLSALVLSVILGSTDINALNGEGFASNYVDGIEIANAGELITNINNDQEHGAPNLGKKECSKCVLDSITKSYLTDLSSGDISKCFESNRSKSGDTIVLDNHGLVECINNKVLDNHNSYAAKRFLEGCQESCDLMSSSVKPEDSEEGDDGYHKEAH